MDIYIYINTYFLFVTIREVPFGKKRIQHAKCNTNKVFEECMRENTNEPPTVTKCISAYASREAVPADNTNADLSFRHHVLLSQALT